MTSLPTPSNISILIAKKRYITPLVLPKGALYLFHSFRPAAFCHCQRFALQRISPSASPLLGRLLLWIFYHRTSHCIGVVSIQILFLLGLRLLGESARAKEKSLFVCFRFSSFPCQEQRMPSSVNIAYDVICAVGVCVYHLAVVHSL
ncbi:hypothetical protein BDV26DRAFT_275555 [Aspergillus bertholletiae]|uniref:Uncharacterized protein n=1 Tax=Aspergillus bertholletiae TaxID=1226010 RepID=A0A5N7APT1_9EURO|nr:hypothetical protein BDV26DRAFT_275555 [Aspergillus bertholletiae]